MEKLRSVLKDKKGVAGLDLALSIIALLFVIGLLVMIFSLMGSELQDTDSVKASEDATVTDTTLTVTDGGTTLTSCNSANQGSAVAISTAYNESGHVLITSGNYTLTVPCTITALGSSEFNNTVWNVTYAYTYAGVSWDIMNDTNTALSEVPDWFPIVIVITFMVVLILLTVMIIRAIRGSGLIVGGGA